MTRSRFLFSIAVAALVLTPRSGGAQGTEGPVGISAAAARQIQALLDEKESRTPVQRKIDSHLLQAYRERHGGTLAPGVTTLVKADVGVDADGILVLDVEAEITPSFLAGLAQAGGKVIFASARYQSARVKAPLDQIEAIASLPDVRFVYPKQEARTEGPIVRSETESDDSPRGSAAARTPIADRAARVRSKLAKLLPGMAGQESLSPLVGSVQSEGDTTHQASLARSTYGYDGSGIRIGVISDSVDGLAASQASGNLGPVTVLPGQSGLSGTGEGTAMLEIVHDLAPGAQLFFATAFLSEASFASNITALRGAPYNCDIIVDDVSYLDEPVFEDGIVAQAVNGVIAGGGMYFSSAANSGNLTSAQSGTWEGDFVDGGLSAAPLPLTGNVHLFSVGNTNDQLTVIGPVFLFWSDKFGASANDYDLFALNAAASAVVQSSTNIQSGTQNPLEFLSGLTQPPATSRLVILKKTLAAARFLHLDTNRGRLAIATSGETHGHSSAAGAFGVAATPATTAFGAPPNPVGPFPSPFNAANKVELFSSDGMRRMFYDPAGNPYTPGNFSSTGGTVRQKPDITAADGVTTSVPGFAPFFGTSAAAPHAAAIAALLRQAGRTPAQVRTALTGTAIDIMAAGVDRDAGAGIIMAKAAMDSFAPPAVASVLVSSMAPSESTTCSNLNTFIEPGEDGRIAVTLMNDGIATAGSVSGTLALAGATPGVTVVAGGPVSFGSITAAASANNSGNPFRVHLDPTFACARFVDLNLTLTYTGGAAVSSPTVQPFRLQTGPTPITINSTLDTTAPPSSPPYTAATGTTVLGRLNRFFPASSCEAAAKTCPATTGAGTRRFDSYSFTNPGAATLCVNVALTNACVGGPNAMFVSAYSGPFDPANLCTNYLGDAGSSNTTATASPFSVSVPGGGTLVVVVNEVNNPGAAAALCNYALTVSSFNCTAASDPTSPVVTAPGASTVTQTLCQ